MATNLREKTMNKITKVLALTSMFVAAPLFAGDKVSESMSADGVTQVVIDNESGRVDIVGWTENTVSVEGELDDEALEFIFEKNGSTIDIRVEMPKKKRSWSNDEGSVLDIKIPKSLRMSFEGVSTDVFVKDLDNGADIQTVSGDVEAKNIKERTHIGSVSGKLETVNLADKVTLSTVSGNIEDRDSSGRLTLKSVSGEISASSTASEVKAEAVSGDIRLILGTVEDLELNLVSGDAEIEMTIADNAAIRANSVSGDVEVEFKAPVNADFTLNTNAGGSIKNGITSKKAKRAKYGPNSYLDFSVGDGSSSVKVNTVSGDIDVAKK